MADDRSFAISSWLFARALGVVLLVAFVSIGAQSAALFESGGIAPIGRFVESARGAGHHVLQHPSLFWWFASDAAVTTCWIVGVFASLALALGVAPGASLLVAWVAYLSFVSVGWPFMSFQWDTLLLETTFTALFFVPWRRFDNRRTHGEPHPVARFAMWWLLVRLVWRSGYVKLASGDPVWMDLSALDYHYWTQPLPTVLGWYAAHAPHGFHVMSCVVMFVVELGAPVLVVVPRAWARRAAAFSIVALMISIALTGNYGFFNALTVVLCIPLLDDRLLSRVRPLRMSERGAPSGEPVLGRRAVGPTLVIALTAVLFFAGTFGSGPPRWLGPIYPFATFNTYGLFTVMTTERHEIELEGTRDGENWEAYVFKYKPGIPSRAPTWVAPHQPRLDWQMWFAALGDFRRNPWLANVMRALLEGRAPVTSLFAENPFADEPPKQVRALIYRLRPTSLEEKRESGRWWTRNDRALYAPILGIPIDPTSGTP